MTEVGCVGWAKRSVPTIHINDQERWWARRKRAFAHPTNYILDVFASPHAAIAAISSEIRTL